MPGDRSKCPIIGWEAAALEREIREQVKLSTTSAQLMIVLKGLMSPVANGLLSAIEEGAGLVEGVVEAIETSVNSISPNSWMAYAIANTARDIHGAATREIGMLKSILAIIKRSNAKKSKDANRYRDISKAAQRNVKVILDYLNIASNAGNTTVAATNIRRGIEVAKMNLDLLSGVSYRDYSADSSSEAIRAAKNLGEGEALKKITEFSEGYMNRILSGIADEASAEVAEIARAITDTYMGIAKIMYMYSGIDYVPQMSEIKRGTDEIISMLADPNAYRNKSVIDDALARMRKNLKDIQKDMAEKYQGKYGSYMLAMSPEYDIYDKTFHPSAYSGQRDPHPHSLQYGAMATGAGSPISVGSLTVYGASMRLAVCIETFKRLAGAYRVMMSGRDSEKNDKLNNIGLGLEANKIWVNLDMEPYEFDDPLGMAGARIDAYGVYNKLKAGMRGDVTRAEKELNDAQMLDAINKAYNSVEVEISEPQTGTAIVFGYIFPALLGANKKGTNKMAMAVIEKRIAYLERMVLAVRGVTSYTDGECENMVQDLKASGLGNVAESLRLGDIASGVSSISSAVTGSGVILYNIYENCLNGNANAAMLWKKITSGMKYAKDEAEKVVRKAAGALLKTFGYSMAVVDAVMIAKRKAEKAAKSLVDVGNIMDSIKATAGDE